MPFSCARHTQHRSTAAAITAASGHHTPRLVSQHPAGPHRIAAATQTVVLPDRRPAPSHAHHHHPCLQPHPAPATPTHALTTTVHSPASAPENGVAADTAVTAVTAATDPNTSNAPGRVRAYGGALSTQHIAREWLCPQITDSATSSANSAWPAVTKATETGKQRRQRAVVDNTGVRVLTGSDG